MVPPVEIREMRLGMKVICGSGFTIVDFYSGGFSERTTSLRPAENGTANRKAERWSGKPTLLRGANQDGNGFSPGRQAFGVSASLVGDGEPWLAADGTNLMEAHGDYDRARVYVQIASPTFVGVGLAAWIA